MKERRLIENEGFYVVLFLCFCVVVTATVFAVKANVDRMGARYNTGTDIADQLNDTKDVINRLPADGVETQAPAPTQVTQKAIVNSNPIFVKPIETGKLLKEFSDKELLYSKTLDQYAIHTGIDIEAKLDTPVKSIADGTLVKVYTDDKYGNSIWIMHADGVMTKYGNLSTLAMVEEGDLVQKGQVISGVGSDALMESLDPPHLHFEVLKGDKPVNPSKYVKY